MSLYGIGRNGELRLTFAKRGEQTALVENYARPPLQVMRPISDAAGCLCTYLLSPTGGVVQNDHYAIHITVGEGAHALFTTQSATKVYKMPEGCAEQVVRIDVQADAVFEYVPDAVILFADSDLRQNIEVTLHPGALAMIFEIVLPGRFARGEHLAFRRYANRFSVRDADGLLVYDAANLEPVRDSLNSIGRLEGYTCWGSAYLVGDLARYQIESAAFCTTHRELLERESAIGGLTPLYRNGLMARMVSNRLETIYAAFHDLRGLIRTHYMGLPHAPLRK
ncbi:MAG: urease accessory protein UreD [Chloroflexota bacterium]